MPCCSGTVLFHKVSAVNPLLANPVFIDCVCGKRWDLTIESLYHHAYGSIAARGTWRSLP